MSKSKRVPAAPFHWAEPHYHYNETSHGVITTFGALVELGFLVIFKSTAHSVAIVAGSLDDNSQSVVRQKCLHLRLLMLEFKHGLEGGTDYSESARIALQELFELVYSKFKNQDGK